MTCAEFEILLCDYLDGTLDGVRRREVEEHRNGCAACAELARDVAGAVAFMERVAEVEPPPELLTKITFEIPSGGARRGIRSWLTGWLQPVLQPRVAMGMAMTILSFSMLGRLAGIEVRQLQPSDLYPSNVWAAVDNRVYRTWERAVKYYENLRLVYEVQTRLQEWTRQEDEDRKGRGTVEETPTVPGAKTEGKDTK
jgi:anti-sigma factor RsiW